MKLITLDFLLKATGGQALATAQTQFSGIGTDSRSDLRNQIFIALVGETFDGHAFLEGAIAGGAAALLIHDRSKMEKLPSGITVVLVQDTLLAMQKLAQAVRRQSPALLIGLTGSNGKTTTKEFMASLFGGFRSVHYSKGSFNNHWGVPMTLLQLESQHEIGIIEMGMNHAGELTELVRVAEPDVVLCTMVGRAHIEHFGSVEKIAEAKEEIYEAANPEATRIYNLDDEWVSQMHRRAHQRFPKARVMTFSSDQEAAADVNLNLVKVGMRAMTVEGRIGGQRGSAEVQVFGTQNLVNLMAAATAGLAAGLSPDQIWKGLTSCKTSWGRNQFVKLRSGAEMIFDAYNANPDSMAALLGNMKLVQTRGRKVGVFGQMLELGSDSAHFHEEIASQAAGSGFDQIFFIGADEAAFLRGLKKAGFTGVIHSGRDYSAQMGQELASFLRPDDVVVVKGSRGTKLERFVEPCDPLDFGKK